MVYRLLIIFPQKKLKKSWKNKKIIVTLYKEKVKCEILIITMKDALNNEITIGDKYGFARNQNGHNYVKIGTVINQTATGLATMNIESSKTSVYDEELIEEIVFTKRITVKPFMLFPLK